MSVKITILMPFRNATPWIEDTLLSIQKQSFTDWELIAVNDHSIDTSPQIVSAFEDTRIRVIQNVQTGIIPALQTGLDAASGEFVTRMDADDLMPKNKLKQLIDLINERDDKLIATGKVQYFSKTKVSEGYRNYEYWLNARIDNQDHYQNIYRECVIASPNWMVKRQHLLNDGVFEDLQYPEDYDMVFRWQEAGYKIVTTNETTHMWREHPTRTSRNSEVYDQASFFELKLNWFRKTHPEIQTIALFGAGPKGKQVIEHLQEHLAIKWYDREYKKYSAGLHGHSILAPSTCKESHALIAVYPKEKEALLDFLQQKNLILGVNAWFV